MKIMELNTKEYEELVKRGLVEEEKKIPERLIDILRVDDLIPPVDENMYKIWTQTIKNQNKINEIIAYLESKGNMQYSGVLYGFTLKSVLDKMEEIKEGK